MTELVKDNKESFVHGRRMADPILDTLGVVVVAAVVFLAAAVVFLAATAVFSAKGVLLAKAGQAPVSALTALANLSGPCRNRTDQSRLKKEQGWLFGQNIFSNGIFQILRSKASFIIE